MYKTIHCQRDFKTLVDFGRFNRDSYPSEPLIIADAVLDLDFPHLALDAPELLKSWHGVDLITDYLIQHQAHRSTQLIAIGGGAILDLVGFVASIYMRGLNWHAVPTTLLAMVDASVGGKTAINHNNIKNLFGSFYPPSSILIDTSHLANQNLSSGKAEIIKMLWTSSDDLTLPPDLDDLVKLAIALKLKIIDHDWTEATGNRAILNAGHTFGHAFERLDPSLSHGQAIAYGLLAEHDLAEFLTHKNHNRQILEKNLAQQGLHINYAYLLTDLDALIDLMLKDKKATKTTLRSTVAHSPGDSYMLTYTPNDVRRFALSQSL